MTGFMTIIQKIDGGEIVEEIRNFKPSKFAKVYKYPTPYSTCQSSGHNQDGCTNRNDCNGREEHKGRNVDVII